MTNDDAVAVLRDAVADGGRITLVVAKSWDSAPNRYFTIPRQEPVVPIDPGAWVVHTNQFRGGGQPLEPIGEAPTPTPGAFRPSSVATLSHYSGGSSGGPPEDLTREMDPKKIVMAMMRPRSGLEIKDRTWLKIKIPRAVLGSEVIDWLHTKVAGLAERRDARKYAAQLLKLGHIKHTVNKITFSEQCYYVFADSLTAEMARLGLGPCGTGQRGRTHLPQGRPSRKAAPSPTRTPSDRCPRPPWALPLRTGSWPPPPSSPATPPCTSPTRPSRTTPSRLPPPPALPPCRRRPPWNR